MNCKLIIVAIAFASLTSVAFAHDGHEHKGKPIEGTASAIEATRFKVKTDNGDRSVEIKTDTSFEIDMYDNKVMIASWKEKLGIIIESEEIADAMKKVFELAWIVAQQISKIK